ncbi:hypothetical protein JQ625_32435 [Bradyrhizobium diazoefficiens]|nr:hypothetical protein [Bradyrhizobium diazoefficiens]MBR0779553.1 hypothetical protein [Bradyrhizobium diazoefficiens]
MAGKLALDWTVAGAIAAVAVVGGVVAFEVVSLLRSDAAPAKRPPLLASYGSSVERTAYDIPGFASSGKDERPLSFPLIRLIDPDRDAAPDTQAAKGTSPAGAKATGAAPAKKSPAGQDTTKPAAAPATTQSPAEVKVAKLTPTETDAPPPAAAAAAPRPEQWRVIATANASYFNLGGHIDKAGIVDSLASPHLRDALSKHSKFGQLPPDIKTHILTQNINLPKIAPYRSLLGMDDRILEQEQAVKFVRVR